MPTQPANTRQATLLGKSQDGRHQSGAGYTAQPEYLESQYYVAPEMNEADDFTKAHSRLTRRR